MHSQYGARSPSPNLNPNQVADEREETSYLRENLQKQAASAAASAAAASSLEIEVSRLLQLAGCVRPTLTVFSTQTLTRPPTLTLTLTQTLTL